MATILFIPARMQKYHLQTDTTNFKRTLTSKAYFRTWSVPRKNIKNSWIRGKAAAVELTENTEMLRLHHFFVRLPNGVQCLADIHFETVTVPEINSMRKNTTTTCIKWPTGVAVRICKIAENPYNLRPAILTSCRQLPCRTLAAVLTTSCSQVSVQLVCGVKWLLNEIFSTCPTQTKAQLGEQPGSQAIII